MVHLFRPRSARPPLINLSVEGSWGASWACCEALMLDSLKETAWVKSTPWQNKQHFQSRLILSFVIVKASVPGLSLT